MRWGYWIVRANRLHMLTALVFVTAALGIGAPVQSPVKAAPPGPVRMVAFGDSVASGMRCSCSPFPFQYARMVAAHVARRVRMSDFATPGAQTGDVVKQLGSARVRAAVQRSRTALVMIGANDFAGAFQRVISGQQVSTAAFPRVARRVRRTVTRVIETIQRLDPGIHVIVGDYWNVMKDGRVGLRSYGRWGEGKAVEATRDANAALRSAAVATGATYVSTLTPFKGRDGKQDPTPLLAWDGDHPDAAGHAVIANAFYRAAPRG